MSSIETHSPAAPLAVIETDAFCERCGFNLRSQPIWRDERLGLLVCRCPECGGHQSATGRASALSPWLHRLALLLTIAWVALSLAYAAALFGSLFGLQAFASEQLTVQTMRDEEGAPVQFNWANNKQTIVRADGSPKPVASRHVTISRELHPILGGPQPPAGQYYLRHDALIWLLIGTTFFAACLYAAMAIVAAGTWFWRPRWRYVWLALPVVVGTLVVAVILSNDRSDYPYVTVDEDPILITHVHRTEIAVVAIVAVGQTLLFAAALLTGRKLVRGVLLVFAPPGVRQLFAFLWHCDRKTMPPAKATI